MVLLLPLSIIDQIQDIVVIAREALEQDWEHGSLVRVLALLFPQPHPSVAKEKKLNQAVVAHAFNPSTWEAEADGSL